MLKNKSLCLIAIVIAFLLVLTAASFAQVPIAKITSPAANATIYSSSVAVCGYAGLAPQYYTIFYKVSMLDPTWKPSFTHYITSYRSSTTGANVPQVLGGVNLSTLPAYAFVPIKVTVYKGDPRDTRNPANATVVAEDTIVIVRMPKP
ncbi:MAG: hypothetical protein NT030_06590 [Candidatus Saganbacteria bacterium]|nr:hypothetical protein [Candidatus Saganbacteria bacterium]